MHIHFYQSFILKDNYVVDFYRHYEDFQQIATLYVDHIQHPIIEEFTGGRLPVGVLLDYIEDHKESINERINEKALAGIVLIADQTIDKLRKLSKDHLWQTLKELA